MKNKLSALWAQTPSSNRREPTGSEIATGFPCGPASQQLFNEFWFRASGAEAELVNLLVGLGITPSESNVSQLFEAMFVTTSITKTVFGGGADFANLNDALLWLSRRRIVRGGQVTFNIATGQHVLSGSANSFDFSHPDGLRVRFVGAALTGGGAPVAANFAVTGFSSGARATDNTNNLTMLRARFPTELRFTSGAYFRVVSDLGEFQNVLISNDATSGDLVTFRNGIILVNNFAVHGGSSRNFLCAHAAVAAQGVFSVGAVYGVSSEDNAAITSSSQGIVSTGHSQIGVRALVGSTIRMDAVAPIHSYGNGGTGIEAAYGASIGCGNTGSQANINSIGWAAYENGSINAPGCAANSNVTGFYAATGGSINAGSSTGGATNTTGMLAENAGVIGASGTNLTPVSPAVNTVGNRNAIIIS